MKKILTLFILVTAMMIAFTLCAYAEGASPEDATSLSSVYDRAVEWWKANEDEITAFATMVATAIFGIFYSKIKLGINDLIGKNGFLVNANTSSNKTMGELVVGYNSQVDEIKLLRAENAELMRINMQNAADITALKGEIGHIAQILTTVYTNSKALPQGVKDMINIECAKCMRQAGITELVTGDKVNEDIKTD